MKRRWLRLEPGKKENMMAAGIALGAAVGVAAVVFYFGRILISREEAPLRREALQSGKPSRAPPRARPGSSSRTTTSPPPPTTRGTRSSPGPSRSWTPSARWAWR